jgi:hypothetical protein
MLWLIGRRNMLLPALQAAKNRQQASLGPDLDPFIEAQHDP